MTSPFSPEFLYVLLATLCLVLAVVISFSFFRRKKRCPNCDAELPKFRKPQNKRQRIWGGWTCPNCGAELDRKARPISD